MFGRKSDWDDCGSFQAFRDWNRRLSVAACIDIVSRLSELQWHVTENKVIISAMLWASTKSLESNWNMDSTSLWSRKERRMPYLGARG